jgi:MFS family permease
MFAERGLSPAQIGIVLAAWSATGLVLEIPAGVLADRTSRRWLLFAGQALRGLGFLVWLLAPNFWGYLIGLMMWGLKSALLSGTFEALVYDELAAQGRSVDYARTMGRAHAARWAGFLAASLIAAWAVRLGYDALLVASVAAGVVSAASAIALPQAPRARAIDAPHYLGQLARGVADARRLPGVLPLMLFIAAMMALVTACEDYWQIFGKQVGLPPFGIGLFVAVLGGVSAVASGLAHRGRDLTMGALFALAAAAGLLILAAAAVFRPWATALVVAYIALARTLEVNFDARFQHRLAPETRATVASLKGFMTQGGNTLLILTFGLAAQAGTYRAAFLAFGAALALLGGVALARRPRRPI